MTKCKKGDLVAIQWRDAASYDRWQDTSAGAALKPIECTTVGWVLKKTKRYITVEHTRTADRESTACVMTIPFDWMTKIRRLRKA